MAYWGRLLNGRLQQGSLLWKLVVHILIESWVEGKVTIVTVAVLRIVERNAFQSFCCAPALDVFMVQPYGYSYKRFWFQNRLTSYGLVPSIRGNRKSVSFSFLLFGVSSGSPIPTCCCTLMVSWLKKDTIFHDLHKTQNQVCRDVSRFKNYKPC